MTIPTNLSTRLLVLVVLLGAVPQLASAQQDPTKPPEETPGNQTAKPPGSGQPSKQQMMAAKNFFDRGQQLFKEGKYEAAWIEFSSAYEIAPLPDLMFNLARCEVKMNRLKEAIAHYREFLKERPDDPESDRIRDEIARLERQMNGQPELPVPAPPPPPPPQPQRKFPIATTILGASTVLFLIFGGVGVGVATSRYNDLLNSTCHHSCTNDQVQSVRTPLNAGYAMFGLAGVAAVATAIVLPFELGLVNRDKDKDRKVALRLGLGSIAIAGGF